MLVLYRGFWSYSSPIANKRGKIGQPKCLAEERPPVWLSEQAGVHRLCAICSSESAFATSLPNSLTPSASAPSLTTHSLSSHPLMSIPLLYYAVGPTPNRRGMRCPRGTPLGSIIRLPLLSFPNLRSQEGRGRRKESRNNL